MQAGALLRARLLQRRMPLVRECWRAAQDLLAAPVALWNLGRRLVLAHAMGLRACLAQSRPQLKVQWLMGLQKTYFSMSVLRNEYMHASMQPLDSFALVNFIIRRSRACAQVCMSTSGLACERSTHASNWMRDAQP